MPQPHLVGMQRPDRSVAIGGDLIGIPYRQWFDSLDHVGDQRCEREGFELQLHPASLDLGQVQDVIDQREQVPACTEHAIERLGVRVGGKAVFRVEP